MPRSFRTDNFNRLGADLEKYLVVEPGDVVFNKLRTWQGGLGVSHYHGIVSPAYFVCQPHGHTEPRFLHYLLRSRLYLEEMTRISKWMPPSQFDVAWDDLAGLPVMLPPLDEQRAIADYLDRETARIDALIAAKERMRVLARERVARAFDDAVADFNARPPSSLEAPWELPSGWLTTNLSQVLVQLTNGYVGPTRDILVDEGVRYIQSLHIKAGKIEFGRGNYFVSPEWHAERPRIHLREGDVLIVQTGDIGQVAVVPPGFGEASCHALQIARVNKCLVSGEYLAVYLRSPFGQASLLSRATGALHPHLEAGIKSMPVVVPPSSVQRDIVAAVQMANKQAVDLDVVISRQTELLREHRHALITAAVTGRVEVPVAA